PPAQLPPAARGAGPGARRRPGSPRRADGLLQVVNGFHRASRGAFAWSGLPVPCPEPAPLWRLADLVGVSDALGYRPWGVHKPEPAAVLP
ncbi:hypothetical protein, partial [Microbispora sp. NPDC046933]|uniref:hypothetical protein n=1 Tax=Microbispora sp. NPDC046933 TaxID=3155618 RepID=UPI0033EAAD8E